MKLLVVEDEVEIANALAEFAQHQGYQVLTAHDGKRALEIATVEVLDVILLDVGMPGLDGRDVMKKLRDLGVIAKTVVIFVTGREGQSDRLLGLELGADDYEVKPIHFASLFRKVERLLQKKRAPTG